MSGNNAPPATNEQPPAATPPAKSFITNIIDYFKGMSTTTLIMIIILILAIAAGAYLQIYKKVSFSKLASTATPPSATDLLRG